MIQPNQICLIVKLYNNRPELLPDSNDYGKQFPKRIIIPSGVRIFKGFSSKCLDGTNCAGSSDYYEGRNKVLSRIETVEISFGVEELGREAFKECYNLKRISMPNSVKRIGNGALVE